MNTEKLPELEKRSEDFMQSKFKELRERAEFAVQRELKEMVKEEIVFELTEDEERMLKAYRAFCKRSQPGRIFAWKSSMAKALVFPGDGTLIQDPFEVEYIQ